jgi:hypothetical protein
MESCFKFRRRRRRVREEEEAACFSIQHSSFIPKQTLKALKEKERRWRWCF